MSAVPRYAAAAETHTTHGTVDGSRRRGRPRKSRNEQASHCRRCLRIADDVNGRMSQWRQAPVGVCR